MYVAEGPLSGASDTWEGLFSCPCPGQRQNSHPPAPSLPHGSHPVMLAGVQLDGCGPGRSGPAVPSPSPASWGSFCTRVGDEGAGELHCSPAPEWVPPPHPSAGIWFQAQLVEDTSRSPANLQEDCS